MSHPFNTLAGLLATVSVMAQSPVPSPQVQLKTALLAAPADKREDATVYGYNDKYELVTLRQGNNEVICLADDPNQKGFSVACYQRDLEPLMKRGRELKKQGKKTEEIEAIRDQEAKAGKLKLPQKPASLFVYSAQSENFDAATGEVKQGYLRSVIYVPYATGESTGLPLKPEGPGLPWLMDAGKYRAHIMINPSQPNN